MSQRSVRVAFWVVGGLVLVGGGLAAAVGSVGFDGPLPVRFTADAEVVTLPAYGPDGSHVLLYAHGATVTFTVPLHNEGAVPITVESVALGDEPRPLLEAEPIPTTRVGAGDTVDLTVTARYGNCRYYHEREVQLYPSVTVRGEALGVGVTKTVDLDSPFVVHAPMIVDCPDRTLDRSDDVRRNAP